MTQVLTEQAIEPAVQAWTRLMRASASTTRLLSAELQEEHGLTLNDYEALLVLSRADDGRLKRVELARNLMLTPSGITRLLQGLEDAGLVERASCATDLRVTYAQLTDAGRDKLAEASGGHVASIRALFEERFANEEIRALAEILGKLPGVADGDDSCEPA
ncbi:MAG TPA: MarR family transcriptional regulator [Gaiellaceae bacterium]|jgi:DNA-binding MarR family transcriptional regulator|nr:MarR family transcriptional regulator [Gaiellaceae bacterium]